MYPKFNASKPFYDRCRNVDGGYGGLLSATFHKREDAVTFFDNLDTAKGPSLGTNFTLRFACKFERI
jgi:cystathionine gamma-synthase